MKARRVITCVLPFVLVVAFLAMTASVALATSNTLPLSVSANGKTFAVPASCISTYTADGTAVVDTTTVQGWVPCIAPLVYHKVANYSWHLDKKKKIVFTHNDGFTLDVAGSVAAICSKLASETTVSVPFTLPLPHKTMAAPKKMGKQIIVIQSKTTIYYYNNDKIIKTYRCAVGMKAYPTPNGTFHIGRKNPHPTWTNGFAPWSMGMPAYIGPGPNNPLGTRAMYVYTGSKPGKGHDTGVRFHGVPPDENSSIGHARSHGCLRMHRKDVEQFYPLVSLGTLVTITK
jgi:lipoprotein-anchoring transpeptidase ErfK/SrfK